jgi:hypothetical protein
MDEEFKVWRYMDFTKFVSMLENGGLFFSRLDKMGDQLEMTFPKKNFNKLKSIYNKTFGKTLDNVSAEEFWKFVYSFSKATCLVNCWHINEYESAAMWTSYLKTNEGIAIQSTHTRLKNSFSEDDNVQLLKVKYIDYEIDEIEQEDIVTLATHKRKSYEHEKELRAIVIGQMEKKNLKPMYEFGKTIKVDLNQLIEKIYVAPNSANWFYDLINAVQRKYDFSFEIVKSDIRDISIH